MAKHKVSELEGALLDAAVAKAEGMTQREGGWYSKDGVFCSAENWRPSRSWAWGGPIIERERIELRLSSLGGEWHAGIGLEDHHERAGIGSYGSTPLIAAMRAYVASRFGNEVELP